jgi:nucleotide-binding universal stress UspA family protein
MQVKRVLCPLDFSAGSRRAMRWAVRLTSALDAELVLFHAWQIPVMSAESAFAPALVADVVEAAEDGLAAELAEARAQGATKVSPRLVSGPAWNMIVEEVVSGGFDLVVMGKHGRTGLQRFVLGSVAEKVVRHASCPVLTIPPDSDPRPFASILVPIDFSDSSRNAMESAACLVERDGQGITLLHVIELPVNYHGEPKIEGLMEMLDKRGTELLDQWAAELRTKVDVTVTARSRIGRPASEVLAVLEELPEFDLVVTGSQGRTGLSRALLGSVAEKIVRHAPCPVLVARRRGAT